MARPPDPEPVHPTGGFATTQWSLVAAARDPASPQAREARAALCQTYWYPLSAYLPRQVGSADEAEELTQEFFARLLEKDFLAGVDRARGKFRAYLLACCKHFLANQRDYTRARKRGGGRAVLSVDWQSAATRYAAEPADPRTPEALFERRWALTLLEQALGALRAEYAARGKGEVYERLKGVLAASSDTPPYAEIGRQLGMTEGAVKKAAQRLRQRYRELIRAHIAATVDDPSQVEDEVRALFAALGS